MPSLVVSMARGTRDSSSRRALSPPTIDPFDLEEQILPRVYTRCFLTRLVRSQGQAGFAAAKVVVVDWTRKKKRQRNRKVELAVQKAEWLRTAGNAMEGGMATRMVVCCADLCMYTSGNGRVDLAPCVVWVIRMRHALHLRCGDGAWPRGPRHTRTKVLVFGCPVFQLYHFKVGDVLCCGFTIFLGQALGIGIGGTYEDM
jgi:hypothetical protein